MADPEASVLAPGLIPVTPLEVEGPGTDTEPPFVVLDQWPRHGTDGVWQRLRAGAARRVRAVAPALHRAQHHGLMLLHLLSCNLLNYVQEQPSARNAMFLALSALVYGSAWFSLEPHPCAWALGLLCLLTSCSRVVALEPLWTAAAILTAQCVFGAVPEMVQHALWLSMGCLVTVLELCWWPSLQFLLEADFHAWILHLMTYYMVVVDFWFWPQVMQLDAARWHVMDKIQRSPADVQQAIVGAGVGLAVLLALPLLACGLVAAFIVWRSNRKLCLAIAAAYISFAAALLFCDDANPEQIVSVGQCFIAAIFVILAKHQLESLFQDSCSWKCLVVLLAGLLALRQLIMNVAGLQQIQAAGVMVFQLFCKHWFAAQCSAARQGLGSCLSRAAWAPRTSTFLFGREEVFDARLVLDRRL